jgi:hypothetical protein
LTDIKLSPEPSEATTPHRGEALFGMVDDLVVPKVLDPTQIDERLWVPQPPDASFLPLLLATSQGYLGEYHSHAEIRHSFAPPPSGPCMPSRCGADGTTLNMTDGARGGLFG